MRILNVRLAPEVKKSQRVRNVRANDVFEIKGPLGKETPYETELSRKVVSKPAKTKEFANLGGSSSNYGQCGRQSLPVSQMVRTVRTELYTT